MFILSSFVLISPLSEMSEILEDETENKFPLLTAVNVLHEIQK